MTWHCLRDLTFPWQPYFDKYVFQNFHFSYWKINEKLFCSIFYVFRSLYGVFISFNYFWADFGDFLTYYLPSKSRCDSFNILEVTGGGGGGNRRRLKKTCLNRFYSFDDVPSFRNSRNSRSVPLKYCKAFLVFLGIFEVFVISSSILDILFISLIMKPSLN